MSTAEAAAAPASPSAPGAEVKTITVTVRKMPGKYKLLLILSCLAMMVLLRTGFIFVVLAMLPSIVAYYADTAKRPYTFKSIFALNLSGTLPFVGTMVKEGPMSTLLPIMQSIDTWLIIYGSAMCGYLLVASMPVVAHVLFSKLHVGQVERIEKKLKDIEMEWGDDVTKFSKKAEADDA